MTEEELYEARRRERARKRRLRKRRARIIKTILATFFSAALLAVVVVACIYVGKSMDLGSLFVFRKPGTDQTLEVGTENERVIQETETETETEIETVETESETAVDVEARKELLDYADYIAAGYDYDGAISLLQEIEGYETDEEIQTMISDYSAKRDAMVPVDMNNITHIFYHSLVVDPDRGFSGQGAGGFKQWMTTMHEFDQITQQMYDRGYVLISLNDMVERVDNGDGTVKLVQKQLYLPEGKTPFVLSLDDLSYYHSYDGHGCASKIVLDENGKPTCEYIEKDGSIVYGDYDCVPRLNTFLEAHPDGAYHGARGTIALTGYNGIFGYRTDIAYKTHERLDRVQQEWLDKHPDFDYEAECEEAKKVAEAVKATGWTIASHTWGHMHIGDASMDRIKADTGKWKSYVEPLTGPTDIIIFAHGQDLCGVEDYSMSNEKYAYLKGQGYNIYCNVDSSQYFLQYRDDYLRMGRRNLDGYRLWNDVHSDRNRTSDIIDAATCLDPARTDMPPL